MNFNKIKNLMDEALENYGVPCSDVMIVHNGKVVYRYMNGTIDDEKKMPIQGDELYFLYSATKPITCTAAMQLVEAGKLKLEDKLSDYIPEFKEMWVKSEEGLRKAEKPITIQNLFSMTSGMNYAMNNANILKQREKNPNSSTLEMVRAMAGEPLEFEPGEHYQYSLSHDVLAAVIEVVSGMSFGEYLQKNIFDVCGMNRTGFALNEEIKKQMCSQYIYDDHTGKLSLKGKSNAFILTPAYQCGGAGLISCVEDYIKFVAEMSNGNRLLKDASIDMMRSNQLGEQAYQDFQLTSKVGYTYGLGVRTDAFGRYVHKGEFGWDGAAGSYVLIDPDNHIGIFYATHVYGMGLLLSKEVHSKIRDEVYRVILGS